MPSTPVVAAGLVALLLLPALPAPAAPAWPTQTYVLLFEDRLPTDLRVGTAYAGGTITGLLPEVAAARVERPVGDVGAMTVLDAEDGVRAVEPDARWRLLSTPDDPEYPAQWGLPLIHAPQAWDLARGNASVRVAILDTGVDATHPDLAGRVATGYNVNEPSRAPTDEHGHGTLVAGIVGAIADNGIGIAGLANVTLVPVRVLDQSGSGSTYAIAQGIVWATDHGVDIISMSLGSRNSAQVIQEAVRYAASRGVLLVAAAGNDGCACVAYPAGYREVVAVGALADATTRANYSSHGGGIEIVAPGSKTRSTYKDGAYKNASGTSFAAPHVAAVAALALSANPALTAADLRAILDGTVDDIGPSGWDAEFGYGRVNASAAVRAAIAGTIPSVPAMPAPVPTPPHQNNPPVPRIRLRMDGATARLDASGSYDPDGEAVAFTWNFGDGTGGAGQRATHTYRSGGTYAIQLTVTDERGATARALHFASVAPTKALYVNALVADPTWTFADKPAIAAWARVIDSQYEHPTGAKVTMQITFPDGRKATATSPTRENGYAAFAFWDGGKPLPRGAYAMRVIDVTLEGGRYDPSWSQRENTFRVTG